MKSVKTFITCTAVSLLFAGCTLPRAEKESSGRFPMEIVSTYPTSVSAARVLQEKNAVVVSGTIRKAHDFQLPGKVDIVACGENGRSLARSQAQITGFTSKGGGIKEGRFSARLPLAPAPETYFRLRYNDTASQQEELLCR